MCVKTSSDADTNNSTSKKDDSRAPSVAETERSDSSHHSSSSSSSQKVHDSSKNDAVAGNREVMYKRFKETFSVWDLVDPRKPWVLVENGSLAGHFDWIPAKYRIGPWSPAATAYLAFFWCACLWSGVYFYSDARRPWWPALVTTAAAASGALPPETATTTFADVLEYPGPWTGPWCYQVAAFAWMVYIMYTILYSPLGSAVWMTYTIQSWTLMTVRHGLCVLAPWSRWALNVAEWIRFPVACSATITFTVWNVAIMPVIYFYACSTPLQKRNFLKFAFSFTLNNIHILNIVLCCLNCGTWANPPRRLEYMDFYVAMISMLLYMSWYLFVLDRLGVHLYPIFSPRTGAAVVITVWSALIALYYTTFRVWQRYLLPNEAAAVIAS